MPLPVAHALLGASIVAATRENITFRKDWPALLAGAMLAVLPDFDLLFPWVFHFDHRAHGGPTHSFFFALLLGAIGAGLLREKRRKEFLVFSLASFSHGVLDLVTKREFGGAAVLWPFSNQKFKLGLIDYFPFYPAPGVDPWGPLLERALEICNYEMMIFMPIFIATVWARRWRDHVNTDVKPLETVKSMAG